MTFLKKLAEATGIVTDIHDTANMKQSHKDISVPTVVETHKCMHEAGITSPSSVFDRKDVCRGHNLISSASQVNWVGVKRFMLPFHVLRSPVIQSSCGCEDKH